MRRAPKEFFAIGPKYECPIYGNPPLSLQDDFYYIRMEAVMHDESKYVIYLGSTIWGFEHACRVANACARRLGAEEPDRGLRVRFR